MGVIGRGHDHQVDGFVRKQFVEATRDADVGIALVRVISMALEDAGEFHSFHSANHWGMKSLSCKAESD